MNAQKKSEFDTWAEFAYLADMMLSAVRKKRKGGAASIAAWQKALEEPD